jgi:predicted lactoylglutathione lyase
MYEVSFLDPDDHVWEIVWMDPTAMRQTELIGAEAA